jgi:PhnB protein
MFMRVSFHMNVRPGGPGCQRAPGVPFDFSAQTIFTTLLHMATSKLNAYLSFKDNARQAMDFYKSIFGGKLVISTFKEYHASKDPSQDNLVMHAELQGDNGITFYASDTPRPMEYRPPAGISMSLTGDNEKELTAYFNKLSAGGKVTMPLAKAPWGDTFGQLIDKFGIAWLVNISAPK